LIPYFSRVGDCEAFGLIELRLWLGIVVPARLEMRKRS
jgi:hypothetical protein